MTVQCVDCLHAARPKIEQRYDTDMVRAGFLMCSGKPSAAGRWISVVYPRHCESFASADPETRAKRRAFYAGMMQQ